MKSKHSIERLNSGSRYVGQKCPVTRTELKVGEQIVVCKKNNAAFSWIALPVLEGQCPYCRGHIDLSTSFKPSSPQSGRASQKGRKKAGELKPASNYRSVRFTNGGGLSLILLITISGLLLLGIVGAVLGYRYSFVSLTTAPTANALVSPEEELEVLVSSETETPVPATAKPTNTPRAFSTPRPTPTTRPSSTPLPPSPTPCTLAVDSRFAAAWNQYTDQLGCPLNQAHTHEAATQGFERGALLWRIKPDQVYVMYNSGQLEFYPMSAYPESVRQNPPGGDPSINPPAGFQQPVRGFGLIWRDNPQVREGVGWALEGENRADWFYGFEAQDFVGGTIIHECRMGIRVLLSSGVWIKISEGSPCG
jgi:hypothetical protein